MSTLTIILEREINGRVHRTRLSDKCHIHAELVERLFSKALKFNVLVDIDSLFQQVICRS